MKHKTIEIANLMICDKCDERNTDCKLVTHQIDVSVKHICEDCNSTVFSNDDNNICSDEKFRVNIMSVIYLMMMQGHGYSASISHVYILGFQCFPKNLHEL